MMTFDDMKQLLGFCAVFDKRKGDQLDVKAWLMIAEDHRWTAAAALRVAREHYGAGADRPRLEPPAITDRIREIRRRAAETFELPRMPDDLLARDYPAWLRSERDRHVEALVARWAGTGEEPSPTVAALEPARIRSLGELVAAAPDRLREDVRVAARRIGPKPPRIPLDVQRRRDEARAELDAIRPAADEEAS